MQERHKENRQDFDNTIDSLIHSSNYLKTFKLEFVKEKIEQSYQDNSIDQNRNFSYLVSSVVVIYQIAIGLIQQFFFSDLDGAIINFIYAFANFLLVIKLKKYFEIVSYLLFISFLSFEIVTMETFIVVRMEMNDREDDVKGYFFTAGILTMSLVYALSAAIHKWYFKTILVEAAIIYFTIRANNPHYKAYTQYPVFYVSIFLFGILFYMKEKFDRSVFYKLYLKREENRAFKELLENTVPSSIFVAKLREYHPPLSDSPIKVVTRKINRLLSFIKSVSQKQTQNNEDQQQAQNNQNQHPQENTNFPYVNNPKMKIVFANSHCKRKFATTNLEFLQKNMNYLFSQGSIATIRENSQGSSEECPSKRKLSYPMRQQSGQNQEYQQACILQYIWDQFQKIKVNKYDQQKKSYDSNNEEVHLNCIYKKHKVLIQEYENLQKQSQQNKLIKELSERSNQIENSLNNKKKINTDKKDNEIRSKVESIIQFHNINKNNQKQNRDRNPSQHTANANSDINMNCDSPTKLKKEIEKRNFLFIPDEMRFDIKIVKCKWEDEVAVMVLLSDISQKVVIDRMRQVNNYKNEMLASITHNLKTPLNGIMLMVESAMMSNSLLLAQKQLSLAQNSGRLLLYMINDLLDYSRLSSNKPFHLTFQQFYLQDLLSNIKSLLIQQFKSKNIEFQFQIYVRDMHQVLINDKLRVEQVLLNLCQNALKFTFKGFVKIVVFEDETRPNDIFFTIQDSGLGISDEAKQNLFKIYGNMFINSNNKRHVKFFQMIKKGVGLGLAVCRKLVSQLGSEKVIQIESFKGKGSSFTFSIYRKHPKNQQEDTFLPKFRSLKYIQIKQNIQDKDFPHSSNLNSQSNIDVQQNKIRRNTLTNAKKSIHFEENNPIIRNLTIYNDDNLVNKSQFNTNKVIPKTKDQNSSKSSSSDSRENIFLEKLSNTNNKIGGINRNNKIQKSDMSISQVIKNKGSQDQQYSSKRQCSLELQNINIQLSSEDDYSEKKQQISIPQMSTKTQENLSQKTIIHHDQQIIKHSNSDFNLQHLKESNNQLKKKSKTLVQFQNAQNQQLQNKTSLNYLTEQTSNLLSPVDINTQSHPNQSDDQSKEQLKQQQQQQYIQLPTQNITLNTSHTQKDIEQYQTNRTQNKTSISQHRLSILQELDNSFQNDSSVLKNVILRAAHLKLEQQFDNSTQMQTLPNLKSNEFIDQMNNTPKSTTNQTVQVSLIDQLNQLIWKKTNLLIVDDTIFNVMALKNILKNVNNLTFDEAYNGQQAVEKVKQNQNYDLIFMDINMPVLDGFEATSAITKLIELGKIPETTIIIVSAFNDESDRQRSFQSGAKAHIDKPVTLDNIYKAIKTVKLPHLQVPQNFLNL